MDEIKEYVLKNFEGLFILLLLVSVALINFFVYSKVAFLNFYYLPIMVAGYYLGKRMAVLGAFFVILMVSIFVIVDQESYATAATEEAVFDLYFNLAVWGCFLILSGALVGRLSERFKGELLQSNRLRAELAREREQLQESNLRLNEYSHNLEKKVKQRTVELERSTSVIESLKEKVESALFSVMDSTVARLMIEGKLRNEKRRISVMFSDLKGFTSYSEENPPEQVVGELNAYLNEMEESITRFNGHIDKYMGDGIMAEFGAPVGFQMHSLMAVLAALGMQRRIRQTNPEWQMRIGIGTGPSVIGLFGSKRKSYSCIGDTANLASRLEGICEPGSVFIDEETYNDVKDYVDAQRVYAFFGNRESDSELEQQVLHWEKVIAQDPNNVEGLFTLGQLYFKKRAATLALECFERIVKIDPGHQEAKVAYAEATLKREEYEKIAIKGKRGRVPVYQVAGLFDPFQNSKKFPETFTAKYGWVADTIDIPEDFILPIESIDGSIGHGKVVAVLSYAIADQLKLSDRDKKDILIAGYLHDLGHAIVPHEFLDTRRKLTDAELVTFRRHPEESGKMLRKMGYESRGIQQAVENHHERFDGSGYPLGLKGEEIPVGSRIIALADTFDAMTSKRLYNETWEYKSALREIRKDAQAGIFDLQVFSAFEKVFSG